MVVPVGKKVRILTTANDVIHAWWIPAFGIKQDAIPGFVRDGWFRVDNPGTYRGTCSELCGKEHAFMPIVVEAVSEDKYKDWVAQQQSKKAKAERGFCGRCQQDVHAGRAEGRRREGLHQDTASSAIRPTAKACRRPSRRWRQARLPPVRWPHTSTS